MEDAIKRMSKPLDYITGNEEAEKAAKAQEEKAHYVPWEDGQRSNGKGRDEKASDPIGIPAERRYWGRSNQKRKGHVRNNLEASYIRRIR